jgi:hypothetical protein
LIYNTFIDNYCATNNSDNMVDGNHETFDIRVRSNSGHVDRDVQRSENHQNSPQYHTNDVFSDISWASVRVSVRVSAPVLSIEAAAGYR